MCGSPSIAAPPVPAPDPNQIALEQAQLKALNEQSSLFQGILPIMSTEMGLTYDPTSGQFTMSDQAKQQLADQQKLATSQTELGLASLPIAQQQMELERQQLAGEASLQPEQLAIQKAMADRTQQALAGNLPLPTGMLDQKNTEYQQLVRQQAALGNTITGDTPESAATTSTSGQQALKDFNTRWTNTQNQYQLSQLGQGTSLYQSGVGQTAGLASSGYGASQGYANPSGYVSNNPTFTGALPNINYMGLAAGYGQAQQPYMQQQQMQYGSNVIGSQNFTGLLSSLLGGGAELGAASFMAPVAAASSVIFKKDIKELTPEEEEDLYDRLMRVPLFRYRYKTEQNTPRHIGVVTEEALPELVTEDGKHLSTVDYLGVITLALKVQNRRLCHGI